jgi:hypothetical protein
MSGAAAVDKARDMVRMLGDLQGPMNVLPSKMGDFASAFKSAAEGARVMGDAKVAEEFELLAKTLDPLVWLQQRYNVTIGEFVTESPDYTAAVIAQSLAVEEQVEAISFGILAIDRYLELWAQYPAAAQPALKGFKDTNAAALDLEQTFGELAQSLANLAEITGAPLGGFAELVGGLDVAFKMSTNVAAGLAEIRKEGGDTVAGLAAIAAGALQVAGAFSQAAQATSNQAAALGAVNTGISAGSFASGLGAGGAAATGVGVAAFLVAWGIGMGNAAKEASKMRQAIAEEFQRLKAELNSLGGESGNIVEAFKAVGMAYEDIYKGSPALNTIGNLEQLKKVTAEFLERLKEVNAEFAPFLQQATELGQRLPDALLESIGHLVEIAVITGNNAELFAQLAGQSEVDWRKMQEAAATYGVELSMLGPKFQGARLHEAAQQIWNDFKLLTEGGADVGSVLVGMSDEISKLVQDSIQFGTAIPENFRPLIEELLESGKLIGPNGEALTDLSQLQFGAPIESAFDRIVAKLQELIDKLTGPLQQAIQDIPNDITVNVHGNYIPPVIGEPGGPSEDDARRFAFGSGGLRDFGRGTWAVLHGRERVQTEAQVRAELAEGAALVAEMRAIRSEFRRMPQMMQTAMKDALLLSPRASR